MEYYIYITTNLVNGKQYIGQHKGNYNDSYLGSGILIMKAIEKYGKKHIKKNIRHKLTIGGIAEQKQIVFRLFV